LSGVIVVGIVLGSAAGGVILVWQANAHNVPIFYVLGPLTVAIGVYFSVLHWTVSDEYIRQHFGGDENARRMREMSRGGWVGVPLGVALIAVQYFLGSYVPMP
jgi:hypothetical protein